MLFENHHKNNMTYVSNACTTTVRYYTLSRYKYIIFFVHNFGHMTIQYNVYSFIHTIRTLDWTIGGGLVRNDINRLRWLR